MRGGVGAETGGCKPKGRREGKLDGRTEGAGRKPGAGSPSRKASPEGPGKRAEAQAEAIKNGLGRHRRDEARKGIILNGRPCKLE